MDLLKGFYDAERVFSTLPSSASECERTEARDKWLSFLDAEDFVLKQSPDLPWGGEYKGRDGFKNWLEVIHRWVSKIDVEQHQTLQSEDGTTVLVYMTVHWTLRKSGEDLDAPMTQVWTIDPKKHSVVGLRPFYWDIKGFKEKLGAPA